MDKKRFCQLWGRCTGANDAASLAVFAKLAEYYQEPHRYYHSGAHIDECLSRMDMAAVQLGHSDNIELAIWFHDVIYISSATDNEQLSAEWFAQQAAGLLAREQISQVESYIMSTTHRELPLESGAKFVVDVDLSGLGMAEQFFRRDGDNIRKEFADLSDAEFARRQSGFLQILLARERIYATDFFYELCETRARQNIHHALARYAKWQA